MLAGDIVGLVSARDLREFDALSFNTGPLYLQGQITILANRPEINSAWRVHPSPFPTPSRLVGILAIDTSNRLLGCGVCAHQHVASARSLAGEHPLFAWEETQFSTWALYSSSLRIKLMPLQYAGQQGRQWKAGDGHALIWDNGRLLLHSASVRHSATDLQYLIVLSCALCCDLMVPNARADRNEACAFGAD